jgi:hypothetical protein
MLDPTLFSEQRVQVWLRHARAMTVLFVGALMLILGFPGLDLVGGKSFSTEQSRERMMQRSPLGWVAVAAADLNKVVRQPAVKLFKPLQRPLRIAQSWGLYGSGPRRLSHLEVRIDGSLVYRSQSDTAAWRASTFRYRRVRPVISALCAGDHERESAFVDWIATLAAVDFVEAQTVEIQCVVGPFPDGTPSKIRVSHWRLLSELHP